MSEVPLRLAAHHRQQVSISVYLQVRLMLGKYPQGNCWYPGSEGTYGGYEASTLKPRNLASLGAHRAQAPTPELSRCHLEWPLCLAAHQRHQVRGTSLIRNCLMLETYSRTMPRTLRWS